MAQLVRTFISFDYDHDEDLRVMLVGQGKNADTPFSIADWSVQEPMTGDWKEKVRRRIRKTQVMAVICGNHTDSAAGVNAEIRIARDESIPYFLLSGRKTGVNRKPTAALATDKVYDWTWPNLKALIGGGR